MSEFIEDKIEATDTDRLTIKAVLPGGEESRAQVTYGNPDIEARETFYVEVLTIAEYQYDSESAIQKYADSTDYFP